MNDEAYLMQLTMMIDKNNLSMEMDDSFLIYSISVSNSRWMILMQLTVILIIMAINLLYRLW